MSSGAQAELDWTGIDAAQGGAAAPPASGANGAGTGTGAYLTDEEILGIDPPSPKGGYGGQALDDVGNTSAQSAGSKVASVGARHAVPLQPAPQGDTTGAAANGMPEWMLAAAGDPQHGAEAQRLWQEHQAFRASFSNPEEARAIKELFPGGMQEAQALRQAAQELRSLRQAAQAVDQLDAAIYSCDARAQSEVVAELARANPAAFRSLFAEAAKVLAGMGQALPVNQTPNHSASADHLWDNRAGSGQAQPMRDQTPTLHETREGWGTQQTSAAGQDLSMTGHLPSSANHQYPVTRRDSPITGHESRITDHPSSSLRAGESPVAGHQSPVTNFDPAAYAAFERSTNDTVARDVRSAVGDTLARVLPEGIAEGAGRRIGDDIFNEIHRTLAADRMLSEQVGEILRGPSREFGANGWRFGTAEQQRVASLLAGRAKQLVPGVARRVIGEWTSSVLGASRSKAARQASAASRVDIAAPGGSLDSMPLRAMSRREVDYASMSDDEILGM